jgi:transposase
VFREDKTTANRMFAFSVRDFLPEDSDVHLYLDLFEALDLDDFAMDYSSQGEAAIHPELMLRTIVYGLTHGVVSGRKLAQACKFDSRFLVLSGEQMPDARTFQRFLDRHEKRIPALFGNVVKLAQGMGLVKLGTIAIDGSKFKANTSRHKAMSYGRMVTTLEALEHELKLLRESLASDNAAGADEVKLKGDIARREVRLAKIKAAKERIEEEAAARNESVDEKKQKSFHDLDALANYSKKNGMNYAYNVGTAVDDAAQIIVACEVHDNCSDQGLLEPLIDASIETIGTEPEHCLADAGFNKPENIAALEARGITPVIAPGKGEDDIAPSAMESLRYDENRGMWRCPKGKLVPEAAPSAGRRHLAPPQGFCIGCPRKKTCPLFEKQGRRISLPPEKLRAATQRNAERMRTPKGKALYRRRKAIVEPVFGNMKNKGMRILVKGKRKVVTRVKVFAIAHNIEKIVGAMKKQSAA